MNYLTDQRGENINQWNPLSVNDVSISYDKISVTGETVTFQTGAAGFSQSVSLDKAPVMNLLGDRVGSFWRDPRNKRVTSDGRMGDARVTALVETASSATVTIWDPTFNLEQLFESPAATGVAAIVVRDNAGGELYGFIGAVAATGNSYVIDIYNDAALGTQSWVGTLADFTLSANSTQFEIYSNESSLSWTTGTVLTAEVKLPEGVAHDAQALSEFLDGLSNGEYGVDYEHGNIHYKKATTGTSDTLAYTTRAATTVSVSSSGLSGTLVDDAAFTPATSLVTPIGYFADETSPDSVDEGDIGAARMTLDRKQITASEFLEDSAVADATYGTAVIMEAEDPTSMQTITEGDYVRLMGDLGGRLIVTHGTQGAGENLAANRLMVETQHTTTRCTADTLVLTGSGYVHDLVFSANGAVTSGLLTIYDNTAESGTVIWSGEIQGDIDPITIPIHAPVATGIQVGYSGGLANVEVLVAFRAD